MAAVQVSPAEKLRAAAEKLNPKIDHLTRPMTQAWTHKRGVEYNHRKHEGENMAAARDLLFALADAHDAGTCPEPLAKIRKFSDVGNLVSMQWDSSRDCTSNEFHDPSALAIQARRMAETYRAKVGGISPEERLRQKMLAAAVEELRYSQIPGFFPTPKTLADMMVEEAGITEDDDVLEPSAGMGDLADAILHAASCRLMLVERVFKLAELLTLKQFENVKCADFIDYDFGATRFDKIVANPPFERSQDVAHVTKMFHLLKPGGRVVSLVGATAGTGDKRVHQDFSKLVDEHGFTIPVEAGAFDSSEAFRRTGVSVKIVVLDKGADVPAAGAEPETPDDE